MGQLLGDVPAATAILDRFLQQAEIIPITGRSYRLRQTQPATATAETRPPNPRRDQPTSRKRNDEFNALYLGLQRHPKKQKDPDRVSPPVRARMQSLQSKDGPVLGLHSCRALSPEPCLQLYTKFEYCQEQ